MCKSKAEGGQRCASHIRKNHASKLSRKVEAAKNLEFRKQQLEQKDNWETRRNLANAERLLAKAEAEFQDAEAEKMELDLRPTEKNHGKGKSLTKFIGSCLKPGEWEQLNHDARERGISRSELVRERLDGYPTINPVLAGVSPWQKWEGDRSPYRQPTQGVKGNYHRESRGVRVTEADLTRLEREAGLFGLKRSDYVRALVMGRDPRTFGYHISAEHAEEQLWMLETVEHAGRVEPQNVQAFWQERIQAERNLLAAA